ncbi:hypothetical protein TNCV_2836341 [Trichonephila clavipes]|nr:hypothetical protein TNCV_2836341 [Trichonephila clavipes]
MIEDLTIEGTNLEIGVKMTILVKGDRRNRALSENFSRCDRRQWGRLNVLKARDDQNDLIRSANEVPIILCAICRSPVELP